MKKYILIFLLVFLTGCTPNVNQKVYDSYLKDLKAAKTTSTNIPYNVSVTFDKLTKDEVVYQIVIDNALIKLSNIKVVVYHDQNTKDIFPSLGLFDGAYSLIKASDKESDTNPRGINLVGYIPFNGAVGDFKMTIKVLVMYDEAGTIKKDYFIYNFNK